MSARLDAALKGDRKYLGTPCSKCGGTTRYVVNGSCVECTKKRKAEGVLKIRELLKQADAAHGEAQ